MCPTGRHTSRIEQLHVQIVPQFSAKWNAATSLGLPKAEMFWFFTGKELICIYQLFVGKKRNHEFGTKNGQCQANLAVACTCFYNRIFYLPFAHIHICADYWRKWASLVCGVEEHTEMCGRVCALTQLQN